MPTSKAANPKLTASLKLLGDAWVLIIIGVLANKALRFSEIERQASGICPVTLTDRLKKLEQEKIIKRRKETANKVLVVYELTAKGREILPILNLIETFAKKHAF